MSSKIQPRFDCICKNCNQSFKGIHKSDKYCGIDCRKMIFAKRAREKYHLCKSGVSYNTCRKCGGKIEKGKHYCVLCLGGSISCPSCGIVRIYSSGTPRRLCLGCYHKYRRYSELENIFEQLKVTEQLLDGMQITCNRLVERIATLKDEREQLENNVQHLETRIQLLEVGEEEDFSDYDSACSISMIKSF
jgi:hypothetical protein